MSLTEILAVLVLLGVVVTTAINFRLQRVYLRQIQVLKDMQEEAAREHKAMTDYIRNVTAVIDRYAGGIDKRISESVEIMDAIHDHAPELPAQCGGLVYWLNATNGFLRELKFVAQDRLEFTRSPYGRNPVEQDKGSLETIERLFKLAGSPPFPIDTWRRDR